MYFVVSILAIFSCLKTNAQSNKSLSNLTAPTAINQSLLPKSDAQTDSDNGLDLGNLNKSWESIFLSGRIYLDDSIALFARNEGNFFTGINAGNITLKGKFNTGFGTHALHQLLSGYYNTAAGYNALFSNSSGSSNNAVGYLALSNNTTGANNTANGYIALNYNITGANNTGDGSWALRSNTTGNNNTGVGYSALWLNTTGSNNTALGKYSMYYNNTGYSNVAIGTEVMNVSSSGIAQTPKNIFLSDAMLEQNVPNPFFNTTAIRYTLPRNFKTAQILITNNIGKTIKQLDLPAGRQGISDIKGSINIEASTLAAGVYNYALVVDGRLMETKQMVLTK